MKRKNYVLDIPTSYYFSLPVKLNTLAGEENSFSVITKVNFIAGIQKGRDKGKVNTLML